MNEASMRRALGLAPSAKATSITRGLVVVFSIRRKDGDFQRFVHKSKSISRLEAEIEAKQAIRKMGATPWCCLDIDTPDQVCFAM